MPNWQSEHDYEFTKSLNDIGWAWEFLRRNPEYRSDYEKALATYSDVTEGPHAEPSPQEETSRTSLWWNLGAKWWIQGPIRDTARDDPPIFTTGFPLLPSLQDVQAYFEQADEKQEYYVSPHTIPQSQLPQFAVLVFDLRKPWGTQARRAREIFDARVKAVPKSEFKPFPHKGSANWPMYLRVIDAKAAKVSSSKMAKSLLAKAYDSKHGSDPVRTIEKFWVSAKLLRDNPMSLLGSPRFI